jgi:hypothetical protein
MKTIKCPNFGRCKSITNDDGTSGLLLSSGKLCSGELKSKQESGKNFECEFGCGHTATMSPCPKCGTLADKYHDFCDECCLCTDCCQAAKTANYKRGKGYVCVEDL